jgi:histidine ammonia-lyase
MDLTLMIMFKYGSDFLTVSKALCILHGELKAVVTEETKELIEKSHLAVLDIAKGNKVVYGINTGFGPVWHQYGVRSIVQYDH